jgi:hypothetical protein
MQIADRDCTMKRALAPAPKLPPPLPRDARTHGSGVHRRPSPPPPKREKARALRLAPPPAKLPAKQRPVAARPVALAPQPPPAAYDDEDTLIESADDAFDALLAAPELPRAESAPRPRLPALFDDVIDRLDGARQIFGLNRDARLLSLVTAGATLTIALPIALFFIALAAASPGIPEATKGALGKPITILVPTVIHVPVAAPAEVRDETDQREARAERRARRAALRAQRRAARRARRS